MTHDLTKPLSDPAFRKAYRQEAKTLTALLPSLCQTRQTALMALLVTATSVVLSSETDAKEARLIVQEAVDLIFDAWDDTPDRAHDLANTPAEGAA